MSRVAFPELPHWHHIVESRFARRGSRFMCGKHEHDDHDDHPGTDEQRAVPPASGADQRQKPDYQNDQSGVEDDRIKQASQNT